MISSSIDLFEETKVRLHHLYVSHSNWLNSAAYNISKNKDIADELVSELYLYLAEKPNPSIWYSSSFNLMYARAFLSSRFINLIKKKKETVRLSDKWDIKDEEYNAEMDEKFDKCWNDMMGHIDRMKKEKGWSSVMLFEHYMFSDKTLDEVSKMIGISKSTTFMNTKRVKLKLRELLDNPFKDDD